jgi:acetyl-CoA carboxylase carboxyltransferase component
MVCVHCLFLIALLSPLPPPSVTGVAHGAYENDVVALRGMREIFDYLPLNNKDVPEPRPTQDTRYREEKALR